LATGADDLAIEATAAVFGKMGLLFENGCN
jgi:hypothetical protein